jgi:hypothetical protein
MMTMMMMMMMLMQQQKFNGKYRVTFGTKLPTTCGDPNYRGLDYRGTAVYIRTQHVI